MMWWKQIAISIAIIGLVVYIAVIKHQRDSARLELNEYKVAVEKKLVEQQLKNAAMERASAQKQSELVVTHNATVNQVRDYYEKRLKTSRDANAALDNRMRYEANDYRTRLSEAVKAASKLAENGRDGDAAAIRRNYEILREACSITTADYNALWTAWETECQIKGCQ
jgi:biopolymer transport protein ExbB/TolQ